MILPHAANSLTVGKPLEGKQKSAFRCELSADANLMKLLRAVMRSVGDGPTKDSGFTLIELMVTVSCIIVIAAIGVPRLQGYFLQANLVEAKPYLAEIAEKERLYRITTGRYCCTKYDNFDEQKLSDGLGLSLSDANNFCFVFICNSSNLCEASQLTPSFIVPGDPASPAIEFEVWAIVLDPSSTNNVQGPGNISCTPLATKTAPTGWAKPGSATGSAGRAGQAVVLRYPPPANGLSVSKGTYHSVQFTWTDGISVSDAMFP
ncbi:MAG: type IV pilin protein [Janthinobacterium lividum]